MSALARRSLSVYVAVSLSLGVLLSGIVAPPKAHAIVPALAVPAAAAAAGIDGTTALTVFSGIMTAATGVSLAAYVGAHSDDISTWTQEQVDKAVKALNEFKPGWNPRDSSWVGHDSASWGDGIAGNWVDPDTGTVTALTYDQIFAKGWVDYNVNHPDDPEHNNGDNFK